ncbi:hypothetical protein NEF87_001461 [Candidatus Lokiarchaeum ossiferum]|uniref:Uncharacterized protein n=1 Tax=Candidatus Lokiarchaeum ossiferum TaxID=2951803 RepID=A0ABY6HNT9_9ARCH|nr:hypothetical protein NEF87_001461 [Candidatus Lokiarchaeum sp. B-35]
MSVDFEQQIYGEIMDAYSKNDPETLFEYKELIKLMRMKGEFDGCKENQFNSIITNSIILLMVLFFQKNTSNLAYEQKLNNHERKKIIQIFEKLI